jgi:hypothetical protein
VSLQSQFEHVAALDLNQAGEQLHVKDLICDEVCRSVRAAYPKEAVTLVLTGSLARNEATISRGEDVWTVHGDVDFFLVSVETDTPKAESLRTATAARIEANLISKGVHVHIGINQILPSYLSGLPKYIATFELRACGEVLLGNKNILSLIPEFSRDQISREDAWRILCNRMIELLEFIPETEKAIGADNELCRYATVKLELDVATSYLVFANLYEPTYRGREARIRAILRNNTAASVGAPFNFDEFSARLTACTEWKLGLRREKTPPSLPSWRDVAQEARALWRWELMQLTGEVEPGADAALWEKWASRQPSGQRIRGWLSVARRSTTSARVTNAWRWAKLSRRGTPRHWIYLNTYTLFVDRLAMESADSRAEGKRSGGIELSKSLPELDRSAASPSDSWKAASNNVVRNYKKFLVGTLA